MRIPLKLAIAALTLAVLVPGVSAQEYRRRVEQREAYPPRRSVEGNLDRYDHLRGLRDFYEAERRYQERLDDAYLKYEERLFKAERKRTRDRNKADREYREDVHEAERRLSRDDDRNAYWKYREDLAKAQRDHRRDTRRAEQRYREKRSEAERELSRDLDRAEHRFLERLREMDRRFYRPAP